MELKEIGINSRNRVDSAQDRDYWRALVNAALNLRIPKAMELVKEMKLPRPFPAHPPTEKTIGAL